MKNPVITIYYAALSLIVAFQVLTTVFQGSLLVHQGYQLAQISNENKSLTQRKEVLHSSMYDSLAISKLEVEANAENYQPISRPIIVLSQASRVADSSL